MNSLAGRERSDSIARLAESLEREMRYFVSDLAIEPEFKHKVSDNVTVALTKDGLTAELNDHCVLCVQNGKVLRYNPGDWEIALEKLRARLIVAREDWEGLRQASEKLMDLEDKLSTILAWCPAKEVESVERLYRHVHEVLYFYGSTVELSDSSDSGAALYWIAYGGDFRRYLSLAEKYLQKAEELIRDYNLADNGKVSGP